MFSTDNLKNKYIFNNDVLEINSDIIDILESGEYDGIEFNSKFNSSIDNLPANIKYIQWAENSVFNTQINKYPEQLEKLYMYDCNEFCPEIFLIPKSIQMILLPEFYSGPKIEFEEENKNLKLYFSQYKHNIDNLPESLESLQITDDCKSLGINPKMFQNLPSKLKNLKLYSCEDVQLNNLPNTMENLEICCFSNQQYLLDYLPASLKSLCINLRKIYKSVQNYEKKVSVEINFNSLPTGLETLKITGQYNDELNFLPINLKCLHLPFRYEHEIKNITKSLEELKIPVKYEHLDILNNCINLKKIIIGFTYKEHSKNISNFKLEKIPDSVEEIEFGDDFNQNINYLPKNIKKITFGFNFKHSINFINYDSIEHLEFGYNFNGFIKKYPSNLKYLKFGRNFNEHINHLPEGLIHLSINERFHSKIDKLPSKLEILEFYKSAEYKYDIMCIPDSTHTIILGTHMEKNKINIPKNLKNITYSENNDWITNELEKNCFAGIVTKIKKESY